MICSRMITSGSNLFLGLGAGADGLKNAKGIVAG